MKKYLVTGAAGFIGSYVFRMLAERGDEVLGLDDYNGFCYDPVVKYRRIEPARVRQCDLVWPGINECYGSIDGVIHLAAHANPRQSMEEGNGVRYLDNNYRSTLSVLEFCRLWNIPRVVLASTSSVYGMTGIAKPHAEDCPWGRPVSPYAASKQACEVLAQLYHQSYGMNICVLRFFTTYGPAGRPDMAMWRFVQQVITWEPVTVYGTGEQTRDFAYVEDIARGVLSALDVPEGYHVVNLAGGDQPSVLDVVKMIAKRMGKPTYKYTPLPRHPADVPYTWADLSEAKRLLGWEPKVGIEEGIGRTVAWHEENQDWVKDVNL